MKPDLSLKVNAFLVAVAVIILGQAAYSYFNINAFQSSHVSTIREKAQSAGQNLKNDLEYVLDIGISLERIARLEDNLENILSDLPEVEFMEITDTMGYTLFFADHDQALDIEPGTRQSDFVHKPYLSELSRKGLTPQDTDISLPLKAQGEVQGHINIHISGSVIHSQSRQIMWDMLTVMFTSLLLTFEFLTFFVIYYISHPLSVLRRDISRSYPRLMPVDRDRYASLGEISVLADYYNSIVKKQAERFASGLRGFLPDLSQGFSAPPRQQTEKISGLLQNLEGPESSRPAASPDALQKIRVCLQKVNTYWSDLAISLEGGSRLHAPAAGRDEASGPIPYSLIRPLIFLFIMADGFSLSFFPMYVDSLYEPVLGLSREMIIGLPIAAFMFTMAVSMPLAGAMTDSRGWFIPLIIGLLLNAAGHFLTAMAQDILWLIVFRCLAAVGLGVVFMCCQRFVIDNTSLKARSMGMAGFLAAFFSGDICGTVIGAMLAERIGYANVFYVSAIFTCLALIFAVLVFRGDFRPAKPESLGGFGLPFKASQLFQVFRDREFAAVLWLQAIPAKLVLVGFLFFFVPLYLNSIDALQSNIGRVIMCYGICLVFAGPLISHLFPQIYLRKYFILLGGLITAGAMLSFALFSGFIPILVMVIMLGIAHSFSVSSQASVISETDIVKKLGPGAGMGIYRFWERAGNVAGPLVMGFLIARVGYESSVVLFGILTLVSSILYLGFLIRRNWISH
ncbi:MFS transporter [Desulfonatronovibrio magnus]|uniref:MFS transporter n=2 Tax=Desulfonatronovibrionaceae TaxID=3031459 RepID=UPI0005EBDD37|nr:MFS transporter [Desulfonatronovibrio magnus]